jgi:Trk-type K+ transport system membrane component
VVRHRPCCLGVLQRGFRPAGGVRLAHPFQDSLVINVAVIFLIQAGALSYLVLTDATTCRRWARMAVGTKLVLLTNAILVLVGMVAFLIMEWGGELGQTSAGLRPLTALSQSVTARTA